MNECSDKGWKDWLNSDYVKWFPFGFPHSNIEQHQLKMKRKHQRKAKRGIKGQKHRNPKTK